MIVQRGSNLLSPAKACSKMHFYGILTYPSQISHGSGGSGRLSS